MSDVGLVVLGMAIMIVAGILLVGGIIVLGRADEGEVEPSEQMLPSQVVVTVKAEAPAPVEVGAGR